MSNLAWVHRTKQTNKKLLSFIFSACAAHTVLVSIVSFMTTNIRRLITGIFILLFLITTAYFYIRIILAAKKTLSLKNAPNAITGEVRVKCQTTKKKENNLREMKLTKTCFMIVLLFVFSFIPLFTALIMICKVKLWYIILINGYLCNRTRGLRRRKAINAKSGKKRLILAQLHRSCVSLRSAHP